MGLVVLFFSFCEIAFYFLNSDNCMHLCVVGKQDKTVGC